MPRSTKWFGILMVAVIGLLIFLPFANDIARAEFSKTPEIIKWQVLDHYSHASGTDSRTISIDSINAFNIFQALSMAERIQAAIQKDGVEDLPLCIRSKGGVCGALSAHRADGWLKVRKPPDLNALSEGYGSEALTRSWRSNIIAARNGPDSWAVHYADGQDD